ncbi:hypothetical protein O181_119763 [Austropuccinia psidii MF-1]|uniref:Uncharacterized protein n=1 Tax=Austropuccinia psidii MF-1 TaxID=1389203 RepID=A0A9Q3KEH5_9BASI|nr:hypothetical protein [Austropuccinia psidii MF-1]
MSWFVALVQDPNASHVNPYACAGFQYSADASHANPDMVQVPENLKVSLRWCWRPIIHTRILTLVQVPDNSNNSLSHSRLPTIHTRILMLVQVLTMLKIPYACEGFRQFTRES